MENSDSWICIHQLFSTVFVFFSKYMFVNLKVTQLLIAYTVWFSQSQVVSYLNASNYIEKSGGKDVERS